MNLFYFEGQIFRFLFFIFNLDLKKNIIISIKCIKELDIHRYYSFIEMILAVMINFK